ncbi:hypothetical protein MJA45_27375 [Paenibacillus aurantius]|uniref:Uncharacterized protein n=1 Tax=Paenibacillus aurantius TaxID=2918900 RepID=A0AA96RFB5_9BACL|nr:hypothetical protein [Paenibacillus aurantius]WNQ11276.1 hypothetical protein MJA45_27375 [Paenibacillus aurantius]
MFWNWVAEALWRGMLLNFLLLSGFSFLLVRLLSLWSRTTWSRDLRFAIVFGLLVTSFITLTSINTLVQHT